MILSSILTLLICLAGLGGAVWLWTRRLRQPAAGPEDRALPRLLLAAGFGLAAFFLLESGVCRRIGPDLLLPAADGQPLPWRALRMGLCLDLALAAEYRWRGAEEKVRGLLGRDAGCWLAAAVTTALFFLWAWRVTVFAFMTNDDTTILRAIGDGTFWSLSPAYPHPLLCGAIAKLYQLVPRGDWYAWYHLAVQAAAMTILGRCIRLKLRCRRWPSWTGALLHWTLCAGLFLYTLSELSFTVTPVIAGTAAVALLLCRGDTDSAAGHLLGDLASVLFMALCRLQRTDAAQALICFWLLAAGYQLLRILIVKKPRRILRAGLLLIPLALTLLSLAAIEKAPRPYTGYYDVVEGVGYAPSTAEYYRSQVMDFYLDKLTDEQLEAVGIPPELTALLRGWYFMDERINTNTFSNIFYTYYDAISQAADAPAEVPAGGGEAAAAVSPFAAFFARLANMLRSATGSMTPARRHTALLMTAALALLLALVLLRLIRCGLRGALETLCGLCAAGGGGLMLLYLIQNGRLLIRIFLVPAIPAAAVMLLMALDGPGKPVRSLPQKAAAVLSAGTGICLCVLCLAIARSVPYADQAVSRETVFGAQISAETYAIAHPDITFVTNDLSNDVDPFHDPLGYPANLVRWGDVNATATADRLYAGDFFRDDVQFFCDRPSTMVALLQYLTLDWGPVQAQVLEQFSSAYFLTDISQIGPGEEYTGWYEQNGMTYYFRNGQALTGQQTIDGETYTLAPAGAASRFSASVGPTGPLYYTDAYSLIQPEAH